MKLKTVIIVVGIIMSLVEKSEAVQVTSSLIDAICIVESAANAAAIGDGGKAIGMAQIHKVCVDDVNRIQKIKEAKLKRKLPRFTYDDRKNPTKSKEIMRIYLSWYGANYERNTGKIATPEILSKIWNGGPNGWKKRATIAYWGKVRKALYA